MQKDHWQQRSGITHWLKHSLLPLLVLLLLLKVPLWVEPVYVGADVIQLKLSAPNSEPQPVALPEPETEPLKPEPLEPEPIKPVPTPIAETTPPPVEQEAPKPVEPTTSQPEEQPTARVRAIDLMQQRPKIEITDEFTKAEAPQSGFINQAPVMASWQDDIPYLDESVDKPRVHMNFYANGVQGSVERFFDKITFSKTFTTKYGTKIHCAVVGILAACSWK